MPRERMASSSRVLLRQPGQPSMCLANRNALQAVSGNARYANQTHLQAIGHLLFQLDAGIEQVDARCALGATQRTRDLTGTEILEHRQGDRRPLLGRQLLQKPGGAPIAQDTRCRRVRRPGPFFLGLARKKPQERLRLPRRSRQRLAPMPSSHLTKLRPASKLAKFWKACSKASWRLGFFASASMFQHRASSFFS